MRKQMQYGTNYLFCGSLAALFSGLLTLGFLSVMSQNPLGLLVVGIPASAVLVFVYGLKALYLYAKDTEQKPSIPTLWSLVPVLSVGILIAVATVVMYSVDAGPGVNFGYAWTVGGFIPVSFSLFFGLVFLVFRMGKKPVA